jgi:methionyl-tRNA synthetase
VWFDAPIGYISLRKNGLCAKEKIGNHTGKIKNKTGTFIGKDNIVSLRDFSSDVESRRKLYFA